MSRVLPNLLYVLTLAPIFCAYQILRCRFYPCYFLRKKVLNILWETSPCLSGGCYWISAPGRLPVETMGHLGVRPPGDSLLVLGRWLPAHERHLLETVEPNRRQFSDGRNRWPVNIGETPGNPVLSVNATRLWNHGSSGWFQHVVVSRSISSASK